MVQRMKNQETASCKVRLQTVIYVLIYLVHYRVESKDIITIGGFYASYDNGKVNYSGIITAVDMARRKINNMTEILPEYEIQLDWKDSKCERKYGTYSLYQLISTPPIKVMLIGGICSVSTQPIAETSHLFNLVQIGFGASSPSLSDTKTYPSFFRTNAADDLINYARLAFMQNFTWSRVGIIYEDKDIFSTTAYRLISLLEENNFTVSAEKFIEDPTEQVKALKHEDIRIFVAMFYPTKGRQVLCRAYKEGLSGDRYVWLINGWLAPLWWVTPENTSEDCTGEQINRTAGNFFDMDFSKLSDDPRPVIGSNKSAKQMYQEYKDEIKQSGQSEAINYVPSSFDAMWAIGLTLHKAEQYLKQNASGSLKDFTYEDVSMASLFKSLLKNTTFRGMTGMVGFDEQKGIDKLIIIRQRQGNIRKTIGNYGVKEARISLDNDAILWPRGYPPSDRKQTFIEKSTISESTYILICTLFSIGILIASFFLIFNIKYSSHLYIKMSSPAINNAIIMGCILLYAAGIVYGVDSTLKEGSTVIHCKAFQCLATVGFSLSFGSMFSKIWRVHIIYVNRVEKPVKYCQLFGVVVVLLFLDAVLVATSQFVDPLYIETKFLDKEEESEDGSKVVRKYITYCNSRYNIVFAGVFFAYKGILLLFAAFLSWETRHVSVPYLNDSRYIGVAVYNVLVPCGLGIPLIYLVTEEQVVVYMVITFLIMFCTVVTLCLIFVPKIRMVKRDPDELETTSNVPSHSANHQDTAESYKATDNELYDNGKCEPSGSGQDSIDDNSNQAAAGEAIVLPHINQICNDEST